MYDCNKYTEAVDYNDPPLLYKSSKNGHDNIYAKRSLAIRDLFALYYNKEGVKVEKLIWNVYRCRNGHIQVYNIFQHGKFSNEVKQLLLQCKTKSEFSEELKKATLYYFNHKSEWEVIIEPTIAKEPTATIIDAYSQVANNWNVFMDYIWNTVPR